MLRTLQFLLGTFCCSQYFVPRTEKIDVKENVVAKRNFYDPHFVKDHSGIVQLFEWKWLDIAQECESFLGPKQFGGVQISPPNENVILDGRYWYERYQPISYKIITRSGDRKDFLEMTRRCNAVGVRIYADVVINHMAADQVNYTAIGTGNSTATPSNRNYSAIPYTVNNFHPPCPLVNYEDAYQIRNCELVGLHDLNQTEEDTRDKIVNYFNDLIDLGVAGFRVDASKHMYPSDLEVIFNRVKNLNVSFGFTPNSSPFVYQEVIDNGNEAVSKNEYTYAMVTEFRYSTEIGRCFSGGDNLRWLIGFGELWSLLPSHLAVVFVDNHDSQRGGGVLTYKMRKNYIMAQSFSLAHPYGIKRIMSSFAFEQNNQGPPHDAAENIISPGFDSTGNCTNGWICEHRWHPITSMVQFMNVVDGENITSWWDNGRNQIAFSRGKKGFVAFNLDWEDINFVYIQTTMEPGIYCDVISGAKISQDDCSGRTIEVNREGGIVLQLKKDDPNGIVAIHVEQRVELKRLKNHYFR